MEFEGYPQAHYQGPGVSHGASAMDMRSLAGALPDYSGRSYTQHSFQHMAMPGGHNHNQPVMYQMHPGAQFAGQAGGAFNVNSAQSYPQQYLPSQQQRQGTFGGFQGASGMQGMPNMVQNMQGHPQMQQYLHPQSSSHYGGGYSARGYQQQPLRISPTGPGMYHNPAQPSELYTIRKFFCC